MNLDKVKLEILEKFKAEAVFGDDAILLLRKVCTQLGYDSNYVEILFPGLLCDVLTMLLEFKFNEFVSNIDPKKIVAFRTKDRVKFLLMDFLKELREYKIALRLLCSSTRNMGSWIIKLKVCWRIVDEIWYLAGDQSADFNFYTKRALLFSVFVPTFIYWLNHNTESSVEKVLDNLLLRVSRVGKIKAKIKDKINLVLS